MNEDDFVRQLREADEAAGPPPAPPADLAQRVGQRSRRRLRRRVAAGAAAAAILAVGVWHFSPGRRGAERPVAEEPGRGGARRVGLDEIARLRVSLQVLNARAEGHAATVERLLALERRRRRLGAPGRPRPGGRIEDMRRQLDRTALLTLRRAEMLLSEVGNKPGAMAAYQQVVEMFPGTPWADIARQRQSILRDKTGETL